MREIRTYGLTRGPRAKALVLLYFGSFTEILLLVSLGWRKHCFSAKYMLFTRKQLAELNLTNKYILELKLALEF